MKENLLSFKVVAAVILAGVVLSLAPGSHAAVRRVRTLGLLGAAPRPASGESIFRGQLVAQDGVTALSSIDQKWDAPTGTGTLNEAAVTPSGQVSSRAANLVRNADGTLTAHGTMTDFDGHTVNYFETLRRVPGGFAAHGTTTGLAGETATYDTTVAIVGRGEIRRTTVTTNADGTTSTRTETITARRG
jgi:hypothetical protein